MANTSRRPLFVLAAVLILTTLILTTLGLLLVHPVQSLKAGPAPSPAGAASPTTVPDRTAAIDKPRTATAARDRPAVRTGHSGRRGPTGSRRPCAPSGLAIPTLDVDAPVVEVGLDANGNVGVTSDADRAKAGWFPSTLAGAPRGSVILTGHTYLDGTAIFKTDFNRTAHVGMALRLTCPEGAPLFYRVTEAKVDLRVEDYAAYVESHRLYATDGPPQVVIITCTDWNQVRRDYDKRGVLIATPIPTTWKAPTEPGS